MSAATILLLCAAAVLSLCAAAAGSIKTGREPLPKTQYSSGPTQGHQSGSVPAPHPPVTRFVFVVGLEGSGHHALASMMEACHASSGLCAPATTANPAADVGTTT